jgi:serine/threonine protein kinase/WD40 repeat protein/tetratricopeptide (TPR) repeat protein
MSPQPVNEIFAAAVEIESEPARGKYLDQACGGDATLRAELDSLIRAHVEAASFLPAHRDETLGETVAADSRVGSASSKVGRYKLLQQIGEGGMGSVWMAEQERPVQRMVALKIIKAGMDSKQVIARFEAERQALALMSHPNIAKVLDAGTTDNGRPYFVMELVKGVPITEFCDKNKYTPQQRLKLFIDVCRAVQHAHQKGIIHRDIKPSNVMVTLHDGVPVVKVIDFGLAKATSQKLTERTLFTAYGQMVGTPTYMSPEQAEMSGLDVDTRTDVYSLGVLLYELMTGTTPIASQSLREAGFAEIQRIIQQEEAPPMSTRLSSLGGSSTVIADNRGSDPQRLLQLFRGDLDVIVAKSLEKDRSRRYAAPSDFADDVQRFLDNEPIEARPASTAYRLKKAYQRHRAAVLTMAGVACVLVLATIFSGIQAVRASMAASELRRERGKTIEALEQAEAAQAESQNSLYDMSTTFGFAKAEQWEPAQAMLWFANAGKHADPRSTRATEANLRVATWGRRLPTPVRLLWRDDDPIKAIAVHPSLPLLATRTSQGLCQLWHMLQESQPPRTVGPNATTMQWSPDGETLAVGTETGEVLLVDTSTKQVQQRIVHQEPVRCLKYSSDGTWLAIAGNSVRLWDLGKGTFTQHRWQHPESVLALAFNDSATRILTGCADNLVRIYDTSKLTDTPLHEPSRHVIREFGDQPVVEPRFVDNDQKYTVYRTGVIDLVGTDDGEVSFSFDFKRPAIDALARSADGKFLAVVGHNDAGVIDCENLNVWRLRGRDYRAAVFSPDSQYLLTGAISGSIKRWRWDGAFGDDAESLFPDLGWIQAIEIRPDGQHVVTLTKNGFVSVWQMPDRQPRLPLGGAGSAIKLSRDGQYMLATGAGWWWGTLRKLQVRSTTDLCPVGRAITTDDLLIDADLHAETSRICSATVTGIDVWDWNGGNRVIPTIRLPVEPTAIAFAPRGEQICFVRLDGVLTCIDADLGTTQWTARHGEVTPPPVERPTKTMHFYRKPDGSPGAEPHREAHRSRLQVSPDGRWLVTSGFDQSVYVWDAKTGNQRFAPLSLSGGGAFTDARLSEDGQFLAIWNQASISVWNLEARTQAARLPAHGSAIRSIAFGPANKQLLTVCVNGIARLWNLEAGKLACPPLDHGERLRDCAFLGGGEYVATIGDRTARIWSRRTGAGVAPPMHLSSWGSRVVVSPDNRWLFVTGNRPHRSNEFGNWIDALRIDGEFLAGELEREDAQRMATLLSGRRIERGTAVPLSLAEWKAHFEQYRQELPEVQDALTGDVDISGSLHLMPAGPDSSRAEYEAAIEIRQRLVDRFPEIPEHQKHLADSHIALGRLLRDLKDRESARAEYQAAIDIRQRLVEQFPESAQRRHALACSHEDFGTLLKELEEQELARAEYQAAIEIRQNLVERFPHVPYHQRALAGTYGLLVDVLESLKELEAAVAAYQMAIELQRGLAEQFSGEPGYQRELASSHEQLAQRLIARDDPDAARAEFEAAIEIRQRLAEQFPDKPTYLRDLASSHQQLGQRLLALGDQAAARAELEAEVQVRQRLVKQFPDEPTDLRELATSHSRLGNLLVQLGDLKSVRAEYESAVEIGKQVIEQFPDVTWGAFFLAVSHERLGNWLKNNGDADAAAARYQSTIEIRQRLVEQSPKSAAHRVYLAGNHETLADLQGHQLGKPEMARASYQAAIEIRKSLVESFPAVPAYQQQLGQTYRKTSMALMELGWRESAIDLLQEAKDRFPDDESFQQQLRRFNNGHIPGCAASWSGDGKSLVLRHSAQNGLSVMRSDGSKRQSLIPNGFDPLWSPAPDGPIAANRNTEKNRGLWLVDPDDIENARPLVSGYGWPAGWSRDGSTLFYMQSRQLWAIDVQQSDAQPKKLMPVQKLPAVSPDGTMVADHQGDQLVVIEIETGETIASWSVKGWRGVLPGWSPDSRFVGFGSNDKDDDAGKGLWILDIKRGEAFQAIPEGGTLPRWSPDGKQIVYDLRSEGRYIRVVNVADLPWPKQWKSATASE